jgi:hypothetical protein
MVERELVQNIYFKKEDIMKKTMVVMVMVILLVSIYANLSLALDEPSRWFQKAKAIALTKGEKVGDKFGECWIYSNQKGAVLYNPKYARTVIVVGSPKNGRGVGYQDSKGYYAIRKIDGKDEITEIDWSTAYELAREYIYELHLN